MRIQRVTYYLLSHRLLALLLTFVTTFLPVVGVAGVLYAGLVALRKGAYEGGLLVAAATLPYFLSFFYVAGTADATEQFRVWLVLGAAVSSNVLTWLFAVMLHRRASWSQVLQIAALFGVLVVSLIHLAYPNVAEWWEPTLLQLSKVMSIGADSEPLVLEHTSVYATGMAVAIVLFNAVSQLMISRWWQAAVYSPGMLRRELHQIRMSKMAGFLFAASVVLLYFGNSVVLDIMPILCLLFGAAGLSLLHYLFALMKSATRLFWLCLMYLTLIFAMPVSLYLLASTALFDVWFDVRKRLKA